MPYSPGRLLGSYRPGAKRTFVRGATAASSTEVPALPIDASDDARVAVAQLIRAFSTETPASLSKEIVVLALFMARPAARHGRLPK